MIFVRRNAAAPDVIQALAGMKSGKSELDRARVHYGRNPPPKKAFGFSSYKEHEVCVALDSLFFEKCAYCESKYAAADARNVEHFRPKGRVTEDVGHPGYWWLASDWSNLLPSCPACNQRRYQVTFDLGMTLEEFETAYVSKPTNLMGKGNSFPMLAPSAWVRTESGDLTSEDPLLIQPTIRDPENHLEWVFDWDRTSPLWAAPLLVSVRPMQLNGQDDLYGKASIAIYGLNRSGLARARFGVLKLLQAATADIVEVLVDLAESRGRGKRKLMDKLERLRGRAAAHAAADAQYAGMARAYLRLFDQELIKWGQV